MIFSLDDWKMFFHELKFGWEMNFSFSELLEWWGACVIDLVFNGHPYPWSRVCVNFQNDWKGRNGLRDGIYFFGLMWDRGSGFSGSDLFKHSIHAWFMNFAIHIYIGWRDD